MGTGKFDLIEFTYRLHILFDPYIQMEIKRKEEMKRRLKMLQTEFTWYFDSLLKKLENLTYL